MCVCVCINLVEYSSYSSSCRCRVVRAKGIYNTQTQGPTEISLKFTLFLRTQISEYYSTKNRPSIVIRASARGLILRPLLPPRRRCYPLVWYTYPSSDARIAGRGKENLPSFCRPFLLAVAAGPGFLRGLSEIPCFSA